MRKALLLAVGYGLFAIGFAGLFLPLLPTTIFWIGAAACFTHASPAMRQRLFAWPGVGPALQDYCEHGVMRRRAKTLSLTAIAVTAAVLAILFRERPALLNPVLMILLAVSAYIASRAERRKGRISPQISSGNSPRA